MLEDGEYIILSFDSVYVELLANIQCYLTTSRTKFH